MRRRVSADSKEWRRGECCLLVYFLVVIGVILCFSKLLVTFLPHPSTPAAIVLGAISIDVILQQAGMKGQATGEIWKIIQSVKIVSVYLCFPNNEIKIMLRNECYDSAKYIAIMNLQWSA